MIELSEISSIISVKNVEVAYMLINIYGDKSILNILGHKPQKDVNTYHVYTKHETIFFGLWNTENTYVNKDK